MIRVDGKLFVVVYADILIYERGVGFLAFGKEQAFSSGIGENFVSFQPLSADDDVVGYVQNHKELVENGASLDHKMGLDDGVHNL